MGGIVFCLLPFPSVCQNSVTCVLESPEIRLWLPTDFSHHLAHSCCFSVEIACSLHYIVSCLLLSSLNHCQPDLLPRYTGHWHIAAALSTFPTLPSQPCCCCSCGCFSFSSSFFFFFVRPQVQHRGFYSC